MSSGFYWIFSLLLPIVQLVLGIMTLKFNKFAAWMMIAAPIFSITFYGIILYSNFNSSMSYPIMIRYLLPTFGQMLFFAGVFMIMLQAIALKKRAEEQQMLLDDITSRQ